jgi:hypothetical protein
MFLNVQTSVLKIPWSVSPSKRSSVPVASFVDRASVSTVRHIAQNNVCASSVCGVSFSVCVVGSEKGSGVVAHTVSAEQQLLELIAQVGQSSNGNQQSYLFTAPMETKGFFCRKSNYLMADVRQIVSEGNHFRGHSTSIIGFEDESQTEEELWRACLRLRLLPFWRTNSLADEVKSLEASLARGGSGEEQFKKCMFPVARKVLLEVCVAMGFGSLVAEYVLSPEYDGSDCSSGGYLLTDVKRVYDWTVELQDSIEINVKSLWLDFLEVSFSNRTVVDNKRNPDELSSSQLKEFSNVASGLLAVIDALWQRKRLALTELQCQPHALSKGDAESSSGNIAVRLNVLDEGLRSLKIQALDLRCLMHVLAVMAECFRAMSPKYGSVSFLSFQPLIRPTVYAVNTELFPGDADGDCAPRTQYLSEMKRRIQCSPQALKFLPTYLLAGNSMLFEELVELLRKNEANNLRDGANSAGDDVARESPAAAVESIADTAAFLSARVPPGQTAGLAAALTNLFFLPLKSMRAEANRIAAAAAHSLIPMSGVNNSEELERSLLQAAHLGHSVLLYVLLDMSFLTMVLPQASPVVSPSGGSLGAKNSFSECDALEVVKAFSSRLGSAGGVPSTAVTGVRVLWQLDARVGVSEAVRLIVSPSNCTTVLQDTGIVKLVVRRLFSAPDSPRTSECKFLLQHLLKRHHPVVCSKFFLLATAAAIPRSDAWQVCSF